MRAIFKDNRIFIYDSFIHKETIKQITGRLWHPEEKAWSVPVGAERKKIKVIREDTGKEAVKKFFDFCETVETLPKSLTGKAVSYTKNQKEKSVSRCNA